MNEQHPQKRAVGIFPQGDPAAAGKKNPYLKQAAREIMEAESGLPADQRSLLEPLDIVDLFDMGEVTEIAMKVMELSGVLNNRKVTVVEQLKN